MDSTSRQVGVPMAFDPEVIKSQLDEAISGSIVNINKVCDVYDDHVCCALYCIGNSFAVYWYDSRDGVSPAQAVGILEQRFAMSLLEGAVTR